jgi:D-alanyl-D-alanine carboxypeptidase
MVISNGPAAKHAATAAAGTGLDATLTRPIATSGQQHAYAVALQKLIPRLMKENAIPGAIVLIRSGERGDWAATFGTRRIGTNEPLSIHDFLRIGSITKTMTATVILQLGTSKN